jgi:hypothetical protein
VTVSTLENPKSLLISVIYNYWSKRISDDSYLCGSGEFQLPAATVTVPMLL